MTTPAFRLIAISAMVFALSACNDGSGSSSNTAAADNNNNKETTTTESSLSVTDSSNEFREAFCPGNNSLPEEAADPAQQRAACEDESREEVDSERAAVLARFCPLTAEEFPLADFSLPGEAPQIGVVGEDFPLLCREEADELLNALAPVMDGLSPLAEQICPVTNAAGNSNPQDCFAEAISGLSGQFPEGGSGGADSLPGLEDIPLLGDLLGGAELPESGGLPVVGDLLDPSMLPEFGAAPEFGDAPSGLPDFPGAGEFPGADALVGQICPDTADKGEFSQSTPFECMIEAERNLMSASKLIITPNPLTEAACPIASAAQNVDPEACFTEATAQFVPGEVSDQNPVPSMSGFAGLPGISDLAKLKSQIEDTSPVEADFLSSFISACDYTSDPLTCLMASGERFAQVQELLTEENPLMGAVCPGEPLEQIQDPASCFTHTLDALAAMAPGGQPPAFDGIPGIERLTDLAGSGGDLPDAGSLPEFCSAGSDPFSCLLAAGDNLEGLTGLLEGGMAPGDVCPASGSDDPAACLTELLTSLPELADGDLPEAGSLLKLLTDLSP